MVFFGWMISRLMTIFMTEVVALYLFVFSLDKAVTAVWKILRSIICRLFYLEPEDFFMLFF